MRSIRFVITSNQPIDPNWQETALARIAGLGAGATIACPPPAETPADPEVHLQTIETDQPLSGRLWQQFLTGADCDVLVWIDGQAGVDISEQGVERLVQATVDSGATWVYSDFATATANGTTLRPLIDYQLGSVRETFNFGPMAAISMSAARRMIRQFGSLDDSQSAGLYDLRLRLSALDLPLRIPETLYTCRSRDPRPSGQQIFDYVDPRYVDTQREMERIATAHLKRIGAYLEPTFKPLEPSTTRFPVEASVIIPVRNRERTIADAVQSACEQQTDFGFNVIVVDNHSTDKTTQILSDLTATYPHLVHLVPDRHDLGIGGCWNLAVQSKPCGRSAVQLDSDDLYAAPDVLQRIVDKLREGPYAMVVGAYRLVDFALEEIPPGLIDHREWTRDNGRNNLLRVNGLGAPRAYDTATLRRCPLPNVSYGEDYAMGLRLSREYEIGRIFDPLYLCRRWEDNTDADLPIEIANKHDVYKDRLRSLEILARKQLVRQSGEASA